MNYLRRNTISDSSSLFLLAIFHMSIRVSAIGLWIWKKKKTWRHGARAVSFSMIDMESCTLMGFSAHTVLSRPSDKSKTVRFGISLSLSWPPCLGQKAARLVCAHV